MKIFWINQNVAKLQWEKKEENSISNFHFHFPNHIYGLWHGLWHYLYTTFASCHRTWLCHVMRQYTLLRMTIKRINQKLLLVSLHRWITRPTHEMKEIGSLDKWFNVYLAHRTYHHNCYSPVRFALSHAHIPDTRLSWPKFKFFSTHLAAIVFSDGWQLMMTAGSSTHPDIFWPQTLSCYSFIPPSPSCRTTSRSISLSIHTLIENEQVIPYQSKKKKYIRYEYKEKKGVHTNCGGEKNHLCWYYYSNAIGAAWCGIALRVRIIQMSNGVPLMLLRMHSARKSTFVV